MPCPCETRTSTWRSFATISSGLYRFLAIAVLLDVKDIPQVGPLQWGRITAWFEVDQHALCFRGVRPTAIPSIWIKISHRSQQSAIEPVEQTRKPAEIEHQRLLRQNAACH